MVTGDFYMRFTIGLLLGLCAGAVLTLWATESWREDASTWKLPKEVEERWEKILDKHSMVK